jgi:hypothetical protein
MLIILQDLRTKYFKMLLEILHFIKTNFKIFEFVINDDISVIKVKNERVCCQISLPPMKNRLACEDTASKADVTWFVCLRAFRSNKTIILFDS